MRVFSSNKSTAFNPTNVKAWMRLNVTDTVDPITGDVNLTQLAENAAHAFDHDSVLDDETHWIWDAAADIAEETEQEQD
jgi:hypothetical protein